MSFDYQFRISKRAKRIALRIHPEKGLEVVLPVGTSEAAGLKFLKANRAWVEKHASLLQPDAIKAEKNRYALINTLHLKALGQRYDIRYLKMRRKGVTISEIKSSLIVMGDVNDMRCWQSAYDAWLKDKAREHLIPMLRALSEKTGLIYKNASIRIQKTRWGSCSAEGNISLNAKLLLQPYEKVHYVLMHELCHLKEMNHSKRFWALVETYVPNYRELSLL